MPIRTVPDRAAVTVQRSDAAACGEMSFGIRLENGRPSESASTSVPPRRERGRGCARRVMPKMFMQVVCKEQRKTVYIRRVIDRASGIERATLGRGETAV